MMKSDVYSLFVSHLIPKLSHFAYFEFNLVPRACDPREGTRGSGIIRFRDESDWPLKWHS
jgi:hypothetical protein